MAYFEKKKDFINCLLCGHECRLKEGAIGFCGVNQNVSGELVNLVYGHPVAMHMDPIEKKPLYHFKPGSKTLSFGTVGCNFRCSFCQNWEISQTKDIDQSTYVSPETMVDTALAYHSKIISFTYNEPAIFYPYAKDVADVLKQKEPDAKTVFVTNGYYSKKTREEVAKTADAMNIDMKSFSELYYKKELKGELDVVLDNIGFFLKHGVWVEVTTLLIEGVNDSDEEIQKMARHIKAHYGVDVPWHMSAFFPNYKMRDTNTTTLHTLERARKIAKDEGINYVYLGNVAADTNTVCPECKEVVISREGRTPGLIRLEDGACYNCGFKIAGVW